MGNVMVATLAGAQTSVAGRRELSLWKRATQYINRPWHCSTASVIRCLDARQAHAEGLPYQEHFLVRILDIAKDQEWNLQRGTAYIPVSGWLYRHYERCNFLAVKYKTSRHLKTPELINGRGIKAKVAT